MSQPFDQGTRLQAEPAPLPRHIAIIMDGNGRWAKRQNQPRQAGHRAGVNSVQRVIEACVEKDIEALTLFAFSSENWNRPKKEVGLLLDLFLTSLQRQIKRLHENGICLRIIGDQKAFPAKLRERIAQAEAMTANNPGMKLVVAANYGGRWEIVEATRQIAAKVAQGNLQINQINSQCLAKHLSLPQLPEPDLFIRTGNERRISNFLLWQLAYTELYFSDVLWPDFDQTALEQALTFYASRQRRFGRTGEQVTQSEK